MLICSHLNPLRPQRCFFRRQAWMYYCSAWASFPFSPPYFENAPLKGPKSALPCWRSIAAGIIRVPRAPLNCRDPTLKQMETLKHTLGVSCSLQVAICWSICSGNTRDTFTWTTGRVLKHRDAFKHPSSKIKGIVFIPLSDRWVFTSERQLNQTGTHRLLHLRRRIHNR